MFYAVEALLLSRELSYSIHSGVIAAFAKEFVKTGTFDSRFHRYLLKGFRLRNVGDYEASRVVSEEDARQVVDQSRELQAAMEEYLGRQA